MSAVHHYENFPVASWLCPPALRPAVAAIYAFARTADDIADEGAASGTERLATLAAYRNDLQATADGREPSTRWPEVFGPLGPVLSRHRLPLVLFTELLSAFEQDVVKTRYADRAELLDYCRRSANPVGRLLLQLYGVGDRTSLARSDAICTALQLINFWQDLGIDLRRGRVYVPLTDARHHGVSVDGLLATEDSPSSRRLVADLVGWARDLMNDGAPLAATVPGRAGWELRLVVQGGLRILDKIEASGFDSLRQRPRLRWHDAPRMAVRALAMGGEGVAVRRKSA